MLRRRIEYPGAFYHVIQRGNNKEAIFRRDADKYRYLGRLAELKAKYDFQLLGYVLMDNHYHLLLQTGETPLHKIIFYQNMIYSRYFNKAHNRTGHLYGGRYKALLILDECQLFSVLRYIHWNPCKSGLCEKPEEYSWSSDASYRSNDPSIINTDFIFNILSADRIVATREYKRLMKINLADECTSGQIIGADSASEKISNKQKLNNDPREELGNRPSLDQILRGTGVSETDFNLIKVKSRLRRLSQYKKQYCLAAVNQGYTNEEIGANISISAAAANKNVHSVLTYQLI